MPDGQSRTTTAIVFAFFRRDDIGVGAIIIIIIIIIIIMGEDIPAFGFFERAHSFGLLRSFGAVLFRCSSTRREGKAGGWPDARPLTEGVVS